MVGLSLTAGRIAARNVMADRCWPIRKAKYDRRALVPLPPFMTSMTAIDSCNTNCTARMTNARLSLVNTQHNV
jgi:hypothetical protein